MKDYTVTLSDEQAQYLEWEAEKLNTSENLPGMFSGSDILKLYVIMDKRQADIGNQTITDIFTSENSGNLLA